MCPEIQCYRKKTEKLYVFTRVEFGIKCWCLKHYRVIQLFFGQFFRIFQCKYGMVHFVRKKGVRFILRGDVHDVLLKITESL